MVVMWDPLQFFSVFGYIAGVLTLAHVGHFPRDASPEKVTPLLNAVYPKGCHMEGVPLAGSQWDSPDDNCKETGSRGFCSACCGGEEQFSQ